jgi:hypothetical protein
MGLFKKAAAIMASRIVARRSESGPLPPVHEEVNDDNVTEEVISVSRDRGKQPATTPDERTPLFTPAEREAMRQEMVDEDSSSYDTLVLPDSEFSLLGVVCKC